MYNKVADLILCRNIYFDLIKVRKFTICTYIHTINSQMYFVVVTSIVLISTLWLFLLVR